MWKRYYTPNTIKEVLDLLNKYQADARIIAGGTDLLIEIDQGLRNPQVLLDVSRLEGLDTISVDEAGIIHLGPTVTHNQVIHSEICWEQALPLAQACWHIGSPQIRNRGTIAGNLATASPANDTISALIALQGTVVLASIKGKRQVPLQDFFLGVRQTVLAPDELIIDINFPAMLPNQIGTFEKLGLRHAQAISVVHLAIVLSFEGNKVSEAQIALGSVAPTIIRATKAEQVLIGNSLSDETIAQAALCASQVATPIDDVRGSAAYRRYAIGVHTRRALSTLRNGEERDNMPYNPIMLWGETDGHFPYRVVSQLPHTSEGDEAIVSIINGGPVIVRHANDKTLLRMLREDLGLTGTKEGCCEGECGACTVLLNDVAVLSCLIPAPRAHRAEILTIEGLDGHPIQYAMLETGAVQCGYCIPGIVMSGVALLEEQPSPSPDEIKQALTGNLCRCTGYYKILEAFQQAAITYQELISE